MSTTLHSDNYMEDAQGRLVPLDRIKPIDLERHELVCKLAEHAEELSDALRAFRELATREINAFVELSAEQYNVKVGGDKGNLTLYSYDGRWKITRDISDVLAFDERLQAAKVLIDKCVLKWSDGSDQKLLTLIKDAFQVDKKGRINTGRILTLRRVEIDDADWKTAMAAIADSLQIIESRSYIRIWKRTPGGGYDPVNLDLPNANAVLPAAGKGAQ